MSLRVAAISKKIHFIKKVALRISLKGSFRRDRILLTNQIKNEIIFAFGEFEQATLRILEKLHTF